MKNKLVPIGELKPLSWFRYRDFGICVTLHRAGGMVDYVYRDGDEDFATEAMLVRIGVEPLPDCTSFDWQPPKEPTALELARSLLFRLSETEIDCDSAALEVREIIEAMERGKQ